MSWKDRIKQQAAEALAAPPAPPGEPGSPIGKEITLSVTLTSGEVQVVTLKVLGRPEEPSCPHCRKPTRGRCCWRKKCFIAVCACGRATESAFISVCRQCEIESYKRTGEPY